VLGIVGAAWSNWAALSALDGNTHENGVWVGNIHIFPDMLARRDVFDLRGAGPRFSGARLRVLSPCVPALR
jgi:hypothetical protein